MRKSAYRDNGNEEGSVRERDISSSKVCARQHVMSQSKIDMRHIE